MSLGGVVAVVYGHDKALSARLAPVVIENEVKVSQFAAQNELNESILKLIRSNEGRLYKVEENRALDKQTIDNIEKTLV
jgi:hypothetical protein